MRQEGAQMSVQNKILTQKDTEGYARLTAPQHSKSSHFSEHRKIEGYFENRDVPDFMGSDRLLRLDTVYGTIQLGYNPQRGQSFLFANIKTSILDTAPSRHQRELKEYQMMRERKTGTQNLAYTAKRRGGSVVILYKMENQPWTRRSIAPYLRKVNMEALQKTMPFLDRRAELGDRERAQDEQKSLRQALADKMAEGKFGEMAEDRARQTALAARQNELNALIYRKDTQERLFFRRLNLAFDLQKQEMFAYYRDRRLKGGVAAKADASPPEPLKGEEEDE